MEQRERERERNGEPRGRELGAREARNYEGELGKIQHHIIMMIIIIAVVVVN